MVRVVVVALLMGAAVGCHSASGMPESGGSSGSAGTAGTGAARLMCPDAGATGAIGGDGLPFCAVTVPPADPLNKDASADAAGSPSTIANDDDDCNRLQQVSDGGTEVIDCLTGPFCKPERFAVADGGAVEEDGGTLPTPTGGILIDGDYQLVRYRSALSGAPTTRRTIALYTGGTYVEWAADEKAESTTSGSDQILRLNTSMSASGSVWTVAKVNCGSLGTAQYSYTASGTELDLYDIDASGVPQNVYTYQRTCSR
ncbi:MAG TPA: hypothetical protein VFG23_27910 [Polyangia bacterium]|nr:hypothetical protein [Polyangia bacterium]